MAYLLSFVNYRTKKQPVTWKNKLKQNNYIGYFEKCTYGSQENHCKLLVLLLVIARVHNKRECPTAI